MRDNDGKNREVASGGVVLRRGRMLLIRVENLAGKKVWTFPKGHPERGESTRSAALREVREETGWSCRITGRAMTARYRFKRDGRAISKRVLWYWMDPKMKVGRPDEDEVLSARWAGPASARRLLSYPSDKDLLEMVEDRFFCVPSASPKAKRNRPPLRGAAGSLGGTNRSPTARRPPMGGSGCASPSAMRLTNGNEKGKS